jgi:hypothetical protein
LQLADWSEDRAYDEQPPTCIHYSIEWKLTFNSKGIARDTEPNLVLAPNAFWSTVLQPKLEKLLRKKLPSNKSCRADNTTVSVAGDRRDKKRIQAQASHWVQTSPTDGCPADEECNAKLQRILSPAGNLLHGISDERSLIYEVDGSGALILLAFGPSIRLERYGKDDHQASASGRGDNATAVTRRQAQWQEIGKAVHFGHTIKVCNLGPSFSSRSPGG